MKKNISCVGLFLAVLVLLPGCALRVPTYKRRSLQSVNDHCTYRAVKENVVVQSKLLSRVDKTTLFGSQSRLIHDNDLQVIYLTIHNLSGFDYSFSPGDIDLAMIPYQDVAQLIKISSVGKVATGIAFSASTALVVVGGQAFNMISQLPILFPVLGAVTASMALVSFVNFIKSMAVNTRIRKDLEEKTLHALVTVASGHQYEGLIFVKSSDYKPQCALTLHEYNNVHNGITFDINLLPNEQ